MRKLTLYIALMSLYLLCQVPVYPVNSDPQIYKPGTKFTLTARSWGMSADGQMEILDNTQIDGGDLILVRSQVTKMGGLMGFIVRFLRIYKKSNTFDTYIDPDTHMTARYEVYKLNDDGLKKINESVYFAREHSRIVSLEDNKPIIKNTPPDIQDAFSIFLGLIHRINTEELFVGKVFRSNLYSYRKSSKLEIVVTDLVRINGAIVYTLKIERLPDIFKYPTTISFRITDIGEGFMFPIDGTCTIQLPILPDVKISGELKKVAFQD